ncbi:glycerol kinase GlpK [Usitatibacter palustris]|uniref:Glycerol kinase n=1 Tax=Usitatibacter palustris TaxID=2732487 RepID=A0A6M4H4N5_9PROT|nr:glycerol kinase GlpK [Usitatibacter palustris]QJR14536.1 Glycerol kinase [Usitatibacter palustris]
MPPVTKAVLALDQGTTSSRAIAFGRDGRVLGVAQQEFRQIFPQPGWVEHDAGEIWRTQRDVAAQALAKAGLSAGEVAAVGITNQRETTVVWDRKTGAPIAHAIVWQDRRTAARCDTLRQAGHEALFAERTGLVLDAYFSGTKLAWILDNVAGARARAERGELAFGTIDTWLAWKLSNGAAHVTDVSNASRTLLFNIHTLDWDDELLAILDIPRALLPRVVASSGVVATTECEGLPRGMAIAGIAGDQQAALFGQACHRPGMAKNTYGTGCFLLMNTGERPARSSHRLLTTVAWKRQDKTQYALEGSVFIAGAAIQWLRDGLGIISSAPEIESLAASVPDAGGVFFVPALAGLGAPYWDPRARGAIVGLTRGATRAHLARATLEAIAFQSAELLEAMTADAAIHLTELRVDGGATASNLLMQMQANLLGVPVVRPKVTETTALGAAYLAGLATGFWRDEAEIAALWERDRVFEPALSRDAAATRLAEWKRAVERARDWSRDS